MRPDPENFPRCDEDLESTEHALLHCPARQHARGRFPADLDLGSAWLTPKLLAIIGDFITHTRTGYPPTPPPLSPIIQPESRSASPPTF
jgi:hypothetical protein